MSDLAHNNMLMNLLTNMSYEPYFIHDPVSILFNHLEYCLRRNIPQLMYM